MLLIFGAKWKSEDDRSWIEFSQKQGMNANTRVVSIMVQIFNSIGLKSMPSSEVAKNEKSAETQSQALLSITITRHIDAAEKNGYEYNIL